MKEKIKLEEFFEFGVNKPKQRLAYTKDDVEYKLKIMKKMQELGMKVTVDKLGNICATLKGNGKSNKSILLCSHTDSVKNGGQYDGPVGVISGLKVVEEIVQKKKNNELDCDLKVVVWACEESTRFGKACLGSKWIEGTLTEEQLLMKEVLEKPEEEKRTLKVAIVEYITDIQKSGIQDIQYVDKVVSMEEIMKAYEMHIEQYQYLYENDIDIGIVSSITGPYRMAINVKGKDKIKDVATLVVKLNEKAKQAEKEEKYRATVPIIDIVQERSEKTDLTLDITLSGEDAHSGSTPMDRRKDTILAASKVVLKLNEAIEKEGYDFKVYFNEIHTANENMNTIAGNTQITLGVDTKGLSKEIITTILTELVEEIARGEEVTAICKKSNKILSPKTKTETEKVINDVKDINDVKIDVRMQVPIKPEDMFYELSNMVTEIAHETGNSYICVKTDTAEPVKTSQKMEIQVEKVCGKNNLRSKIIPSWAGHDIAHIGIIEKLLLFIKSTGGSHNPNENTQKEYIEKGIIALTGSVEEDLAQLHQTVEQVEYIENHSISEILENKDKKHKKGAIREVLFKMAEAKQMGINISKRAQEKIKSEITTSKSEEIQI